MFSLNAARSRPLLNLIMLCCMGLGATVTAIPASAAPGSTADDTDLQALMGMLSQGYSSTNCTPVEATGGRRAAVKCGQNSDPGGPTDAFFTLYSDPGVMAADFADDLTWDELFACPGISEPSPTTWHFHDSDQAGGSLSCGSFGGASAEVEWTSDDNLLLGSVSGPDIVPLYQWWTAKG